MDSWAALFLQKTCSQVLNVDVWDMFDSIDLFYFKNDLKASLLIQTTFEIEAVQNNETEIPSPANLFSYPIRNPRGSPCRNCTTLEIISKDIISSLAQNSSALKTMWCPGSNTTPARVLRTSKMSQGIWGDTGLRNVGLLLGFPTVTPCSTAQLNMM